MSSRFNITPFEPWSYNGDPLPVVVYELVFIAEMKQIWPEIEIWETPMYGGIAWELNYSLSYVPEKDCMQGSVSRDGWLSVNARGELITFAKLAVWYRGYVPLNHKLYMWWDTNVKPIELTPAFTVYEFINTKWWED